MTNYTFITIIGIITIIFIIAINYCQSKPATYLLLLISFVNDLVHSPILHCINYVILLPYHNYNCHRYHYYGD